GVFQHYLSLRPDDPHDARHELLKLYTQARYNKETRNLAEKLLAANSKDVDALRALIQSDVNDGNYTAALDACRKLNALRPENLWWQCNELDLMDRAHIAAGEIVAHARSLHDQHPDDARQGVVLSVAEAQYGHDLASARSTLEAAAKLPPPDADSVIQMVTLLDRQKDFQLADDLLSRAIARQPGQPALLRTIVQRTWERQRPADVIARLEKVDLQSASADPALVGYKALALYQLSRPADARPLVDALAARSDDVSQAWATALRARFAAAPLPVAEAVKKYRDAIDRDPANTVFHWMLGEAYASAGATDLAVRQWTTAGTQSPAWAWPYCLISRTLSSVGRYAEALGAAETARQRAPESEAAETCYALAWFGMDYTQTPRGAEPGDKSLLGLVGEIQKVWKNEPTTLPIYVSLLCRQGRRDQASEVVSQALAAQPPCPAETLIRLTVACDQEHLRPGTEILDIAEKLHGPRADIALARAVSLATQGHPQDALNSIESASRAHPNDIPWQLAEAQFCD